MHGDARLKMLPQHRTAAVKCNAPGFWNDHPSLPLYLTVRAAESVQKGEDLREAWPKWPVTVAPVTLV